MKLCDDCNKAPRMRSRRVCNACRHKRVDAAAKKKLTAASKEYKIGAHGFVYLRVGNDWIKSSLTPWQVKLSTGERLAV